MNTAVRRIFFSGFTFWIVLAIVGSFFIFPLREKLRFGIDLVGGTYITLDVQTDEAVQSELGESLQRILAKLKKEKIETPASASVQGLAIELVFASAEGVNAAAESIRSHFINDQSGLEQAVEGNQIKVRFNERRAKKIKDEAVKSNIAVLRARLNKMGVEEITIASHGEKSIVVELPDVTDRQQARAMIGKVAKLEFKLVERMGSSPEDILYELGQDLPKDKEILPGTKEGEFYLVSRYTDITGAQLKDASAGQGGKLGMGFVVNFKFSPEGGERFYKLTGRNYGKHLAVILDGVVITAPTINAAIRSEGYIEGMESLQKAKELALMLKSGAFAASVKFEEERQIGPTLGASSVRQGFIACLVGLLVLLVFCIFFYKLSGLLAFSVLLYNLFVLLLGMVWLRATLTLPGIAGLVLTVGMAVDASVLIFERIREDISLGMTIKKAVNTGISDATRVILDANICHLIVSVVLYQFGTGPVKGFAVTLMFGIIATLITGLFLLRSLFNAILDIFDVQKLSI